MAFVAPLIALAGTAGSVGLTTAATVASIASAGIGAYSSFQASAYEAEVATSNANIAEANRKRTIFTGSVEAQDQDIAARGELGALIARAGASGLNLGAGSKAQSITSKQELADQDRGRITQNAAVEAAGFGQQSADFKASAKQSKTAGRLAVLEGVTNIGSSAISGASKVQKIKASRLARSA